MRMLAFIVVVLFGCDHESPRLWVNKVHVIGEHRTDSVYALQDSFVSLTLGSTTTATEKYYTASHQVIPYNAAEKKSVMLTVSDSLGNRIKFTDDMAFVNHMIGRGYELGSEQKNKYGGAYTFNKAK